MSDHPTCRTCEFFVMCTREECENPGDHGYCYVDPDPAFGDPEDGTVRMGSDADRPACRHHQDLVLRNIRRLRIEQEKILNTRRDFDA